MSGVLYVIAFFAVIVGLNVLILYVWPRFSPLRHQGYRAEIHPPAGDVSHRFDPVRSWSGRGGARVGRMNATYPLARIDVDAEYAAVRSPWGTVMIGRSEVTGVRVIGFISSGIHFDSADGRFDGLIFWTFATSDVLNQLRWFGWPTPTTLPPIGTQPGSEPSVKYPWLPPPPNPTGRQQPPLEPVPPRPPGDPSHPARRPARPHVSLLRTVRSIGHYLSAAMVVTGGVLVALSFIPAVGGHLDLTAIAFASYPLVFFVFVVALFSLHNTTRAHRPYRPMNLFSAIPLGDSWPRRLLLFAVMLTAVVMFWMAAEGPASPQRSESGYTIERNGIAQPASRADYERAYAAQQRPPSMITLVFVTFAYVILADAGSRPKTDRET